MQSREMGYNYGCGYGWKNRHEKCDDIDERSFEEGFTEGQRRRSISDELEREIDEDYRSFGY